MSSIADPTLWGITLAGLAVLFFLDFLVTRKPHEVSLKEAAGWSAFYVTLPVMFGVWLWSAHGGEIAEEFYAGYIVEKSLSVDNLFIFMLLLAGFAVPKAYQQRVLLIGVAGALLMRGVMIALGASLLTRFTWMFGVFGAILLISATKVYRDTRSGEEQTVAPSEMRIVQAIRRIMPVTDDYRGTRMVDRVGDSKGRAGRLALTPLAVVTLAVLFTDAVFAVDSVPAVYGITGDPYLVFATNAFALLGLRALYFIVHEVLSKLSHLGYGLAIILAFIGYKLVAHWAHAYATWLPTPSTGLSLAVIVGVLVAVTLTSLIADRRSTISAERPERVA